jgi:hypothetical protein
VTPLNLIETEPGEFSLILNVGETQTDDVVNQLGHEPNGYFWEGVAELLVGLEAPELDGRFEYDSEGSMFCAYGSDRAALQRLGTLMSAVANDEDGMRELLATAEEAGFEFHD